MEFDFLKDFTRRMKHVGAYAMLFQNSLQKQTWKQFGFEYAYEQTNVIFSVLLFIMEQSLKEETCTMDDIGIFIDGINITYFQKKLSYDDCKKLAEFIVNVVLCDDGKAMYFQGMDYETANYQEIHISFLANKVIYIDGDVKRTSYYLTEDGYNLLLSTLEIESNMKLTIQEMIFKLHLEKASYDRAADDMKKIFNLLRIQLHKIQDAMQKIRQNALSYSVAEYSKVLDENMTTIDETKNKFLGYREYVNNLVKELEQQELHIHQLAEKERSNLEHLKTIEGYLNRALDEYQKILLNHFDLKSLYTKELEALSEVSLVKRFQMNRDLFEPLLQNPIALERLELFLRPLFADDCTKIYHPEKAFAFQKMNKARELEESETLLEFDTEAMLQEQNEYYRKKWLIYEDALAVLLLHAYGKNTIRLSEFSEFLTKEDEDKLFPTVEIFREIMVELLKEHSFDILSLRKELEEHFLETRKQFMIGRSVLEVIDAHPILEQITYLEVERVNGAGMVVFHGIKSEGGGTKNIHCSDVLIRVVKR